MKNYSELFDAFNRAGIALPQELQDKLKSRIDSMIDYEPRIGFFGKTGAGKSSLCNALFGQEICAVSDVEACTREPQEVLLGVASRGIKLIDVPGVGENRDRDLEYGRLYDRLLPELDLVLWVVKADDRALASDESFYRTVVKPHLDQGKPFFIVINQVDKMEPFREWNEAERRPGPRQAANIEAKRQALSGYFGLPLQQMLPVSAGERYGLVELVDAVIYALPKEKQITVARMVREENLREETRTHARESFADQVIDFCVECAPIPQVFKEPAKKAIKAIKDFFCGWW